MPSLFGGLVETHPGALKRVDSLQTVAYYSSAHERLAARDRQLEKSLAMRHEIRICSVTKDGGPKDTVYL